jgi:hypothetical protein
VAEVGEAGAGDQAHIARTDHRYAHSPSSAAWEPRRLSPCSFEPTRLFPTPPVPGRREESPLPGARKEGAGPEGPAPAFLSFPPEREFTYQPEPGP